MQEKRLHRDLNEREPDIFAVSLRESDGRDTIELAERRAREAKGEAKGVSYRRFQHPLGPALEYKYPSIPVHQTMGMPMSNMRDRITIYIAETAAHRPMILEVEGFGPPSHSEEIHQMVTFLSQHLRLIDPH